MKTAFRPSCVAAASAVLLGVLPASGATLTGLWQFENPANPGQASIGSDLIINGTAPAHSATLADDFSTSLSGVVTTVGGAANGFTAAHGILANGGGAFVNEYTILADIFTPAGSRGSWRTIFQTNTGNTNDGEFFIRNDNDNLGTGSLTYSTTPINEAKWSRLVITFDLEPAAANTIVRSYLDGVLLHTHTSASIEIQRDERYSLDPTILFFRDNDGDNAPLNVGAVAIWNGALTGAEVAALGGAGAAVPEPGSIAFAGLALGAALRFRRRGKRA